MRKYQHYLRTGSAAVLLFIIGLFASVQTWAQERDVNININAEDESVAWYNLWWVWAVGLALFIIIVVAAIGASKKT